MDSNSYFPLQLLCTCVGHSQQCSWLLFLSLQLQVRSFLFLFLSILRSLSVSLYLSLSLNLHFFLFLSRPLNPSFSEAPSIDLAHCLSKNLQYFHSYYTFPLGSLLLKLNLFVLPSLHYCLFPSLSRSLSFKLDFSFSLSISLVFLLTFALRLLLILKSNIFKFNDFNLSYFNLIQII